MPRWRNGIIGVYVVLTYHTSRKFRPCYSDNMIQHGMNESWNERGSHGIYPDVV